MANHNDIFELVEAYVNGELSDSELANFEAELSTNVNLQKQLILAQAAQKLVIQNRLLQVKALANEEASRLNNKRNQIHKFLIGGSVALVAVVTGLYIIIKSKEPNEIKLPAPQEIQQKETPTSTLSEISELDEQVQSTTNTASQEETQPQPVTVTKKETPPPPSDIQKDTIVIVDTTTVMKNSPTVETPEKPEKTTKTKPACNTANIKADIHTISGCEGKNENAIEIGKISGLTGPIKKQVFNAENELILSHYGLKDGNYTVVIVGAETCKKRFPVTLKSKNCPINVDFNPNYGEVWEIPTISVSGVLTIYTKTGLEIVRKPLPAGEVTTWDGKNSANEIQAGYFIFTINYEDGSFLKGGITVTQ